MLRDILPKTVDPEYRKSELVTRLYNSYKNGDEQAQQNIHNEFADEINDNDELTFRVINYYTSDLTAIMMLAEKGPINLSLLPKCNPNELYQNTPQNHLNIVMGYVRGGHSKKLIEEFENSIEEQPIWNLVVSYISCGDFKKFNQLNLLRNLEKTMRDPLTLDIYQAIDLGYRVVLENNVCVNVDQLIELMSYIENVKFREHLAELTGKYLLNLNLNFVLQQAAKNHRLIKEYDLDYDLIQALKIPGMRSWLLQGQQLVHNGRIPYDVYMVITASLLKLPLDGVYKVYKAVNKKIYENIHQKINDEYKSHYFPTRLFYYPAYLRQLDQNEERYRKRIGFSRS